MFLPVIYEESPVWEEANHSEIQMVGFDFSTGAHTHTHRESLFLYAHS